MPSQAKRDGKPNDSGHDGDAGGDHSDAGRDGGDVDDTDVD